MAQFAELVLVANTESLKKGRDELGRFKKAGADTEQGVTQSTNKMSKGFGVAGAAAITSRRS